MDENVGPGYDTATILYVPTLAFPITEKRAPGDCT